MFPSHPFRPYSATQHCLGVEEILRIIFGHVLGEDRRPLRDTGKCTVARLARTTRAFESPSLDVLWRTQTSLYPLLKLMPPDLWRVEAVANHRRRLVCIFLVVVVPIIDYLIVTNHFLIDFHSRPIAN